MEYVEYYQENTNLMLLYWYLLKLYNEDILLREWYHYKSDFKKWICIHWSYMKKYLNIDWYDQKRLINKILEYWFIKDWYVYLYSWEADWNFNIPLKEKFKINNKWVEKLNNESLLWGSFILLDLDINYKTIEEHIKAYIEEWKEWLIYKEWKNYLHFKWQVDETVAIIYNKLQKYSHKSLWVNRNDYNLAYNEELNLFATLTIPRGY